MERDALIAHGTSFLLQDRLMNCSDYSTTWVCRRCGSIISLGFDDVSLGTEVKPGFELIKSTKGEYCRICRSKDAGQRQLNSSDEMLYTQNQVNFFYPMQNVIDDNHKSDLDVVAVPFVFRYLCAELAAMGIAVMLEVR